VAVTTAAATDGPVPAVANVPVVVAAETTVVAAVPDTDGPVPTVVGVSATRIVYEICDLRQLGGFLLVLRFPPPIKLTVINPSSFVIDNYYTYLLL
jgi:hypothetical protein